MPADRPSREHREAAYAKLLASMPVPTPQDHQRAQAAYDANPELQAHLEAAMTFDTLNRPRRKPRQDHS